MKPLLFLSHRLPFPPSKGDKVRSCHFLRHLAERHRVYLGTFVDDPADFPHVQELRRWCAGVYVEPLVPWMRRVASAQALPRGEALTLAYFRSTCLTQWVRDIVSAHRIKRAFAFSSPMAQYVLDLPLASIVDFVDMDSAKWGAYAERRRWPAAMVYRREAQRLLAFETSVAARAQATLFVTEEERRRFLAAGDVAPRVDAKRVFTVPNGVDRDYFSPNAALPNPFSAEERSVVFTGAMDYWPNVDAVVWFAHEVLPLLRRRDPAIRFWIVGMNPEGAVRALAADPAVTVTGRVEDVRPYLQHAAAVVAPLRIARGIQNKVLEAMAMAKPVVATPACAAALPACSGEELETAGDAEGFASKVLEVIGEERGASVGRAARNWVERHCSWSASFDRLDELLEGPGRAAREAMAR